MYMRKSNGPNTDPCGTPDSTCEDVVPLTTTHWVLFDRKSVIHAKISLLSIAKCAVLLKMGHNMAEQDVLHNFAGY